MAPALEVCYESEATGMTHRFTDRDGTEWSIWWGYPPGTPVAVAGVDLSKIPPEPSFLYFRVGEPPTYRDGFSVPMSVVNPADIEDAELQKMINTEYRRRQMIVPDPGG